MPILMDRPQRRELFVPPPSVEHLAACWLDPSEYFYANPGSRKNVSSIYLRRVRKAGSTTVFDALEGLVKNQGLHFQSNEQSQFNPSCLLTPLALSFLFVTHLREPMERIKSEFWYVGPGSRNETNSEEVWASWMEGSRKKGEVGGNHSCRLHGGTLVDNLQVRAFTGSCGDCKVKANGKFSGCMICTTKNKVVKDPVEKINMAHTAAASRTLEKFDLVIIIELLSHEAHLRRIRSVLGAPASFSFKHARGDPLAHGASSHIPPNALMHLEALNDPDLALYSQWRKRALCAWEYHNPSNATATSPDDRSPHQKRSEKREIREAMKNERKMSKGSRRAGRIEKNEDPKSSKR